MSKVLIVDDSDASVVYTGSWTTETSVASNTNEYNSTVHRSTAVGDRLSYSFYGTGISVYGTLDTPATNGAPSASFSIDNEITSTFNSTGNVIVDRPDIATSHTLLYSSPSLTKESHTLYIRTIAATNAAAHLYVDFFTVATGSDSAAGNIIVDERDAAVSYAGGSWVNNGIRAEYLGTTRQSPSDAQGGSATFRFNGTAIAVYGTTAATIGAGTTSSMDFSIDSVHQRTFNGPKNSPAILHTTLFEIAGLSNDQEHTVVMKTLNTNPWFLDYMIYTTENSAIPGGGGQANNPSGRNGGAIAGAVIAAIIGGLALVGIAVILQRRRRVERKNEIDYESAKIADGTAKPFLVPFTNSQGHTNGDARIHDDGIPVNPFVSPGVNGVIPPSKSGGASTTQVSMSPSHLGGAPSAYSGAPPAGSQYMDGSVYSGIEREPMGSPQAQSNGYGDHPHNNPLYPQFDAGRGGRGGPPSVYGSIALRPPNDTYPMVSPPFEQDSGIRIPSAAPPSYTPD